MATIIVSGGEKGGTGKTMFATTMAVCFKLTGFDALLVDADGQGSARRWAMKRAELLRAGQPATLSAMPVNVPWVVLTENTYYSLRELAERYEVIIVDAGGADSEEFRTAISAANGVYTSVIPSDCDLGTLPVVREAVQGARQLGNRTLLARVLLNKCSNHPHAADVDEAREFVAGEVGGLEMTKAVIHHRDPFKNAYKARLTVTEFAAYLRDKKLREGARLAADEIATLFAEVCADFSLVPRVPLVPHVQAVHNVHAVPESP